MKRENQGRKKSYFSEAVVGKINRPLQEHMMISERFSLGAVTPDSLRK